MTYAARKYRHVAITVVIAAILATLDYHYDLAMRDASFLSGWLLAAGLVLLALYNIRKKLPFLPLLKSAQWLQLHIYVGWLVILLFLLHTGFRLPSGPLEIVLWALFVAVAGSGVAGIALSRSVPRRLRLHGERIIFERIPQFRARLAAEVEELAMRSVKETSSNAIADCYAVRLLPYFAGPRNFNAHLRGSQEPLLRLRREIKSIERYLSKEGKEILAEIESRVVAKHNLDYQHVWQLVLKGWLFVHIPLTYSLVLFGAVHIVLVYAFAGEGL